MTYMQVLIVTNTLLLFAISTKSTCGWLTLLADSAGWLAFRYKQQVLLIFTLFAPNALAQVFGEFINNHASSGGYNIIYC